MFVPVRPRRDTSVHELGKAVFLELATSLVEGQPNHIYYDSSGKSDTNLLIAGIRAVEAQILLIGTLGKQGKCSLGSRRG